MSEIINRSLVQIQTSKALAVPQRRAGEECEFEIAPGVKMVMCWIPPGEFLMGSPEDEEGGNDDETLHRVRIAWGFWIAKTQTTQAQWRAVMGGNPSRFKGEKMAVEKVSWIDICGDESATGGYLGKLNERLPTRYCFHLPTEAQWEYACRAGTTEAYAGDLDEMGWYDDNSERQTHPVGQKMPNAWGLHDMHGNVWEWCADWYGKYCVGTVTDPTGPDDGLHRVIRGGSRDGDAYDCRAAFRNYYHPGNLGDDLGFRIARSIVP